LAILVGLLWIRSYWYMDGLSIPIRGTRYLMGYSRIGVVTLGWESDSQRTGKEGISWHARDVEPYLQQKRIMQDAFADANRKSGRKVVFNPDRPFGWRTGSVTHQGRTLGGVSVTFPHWILLLLLSVSPGVRIAIGYRRYHRQQTNRCAKCGYDLTGNVSGVCPECGTAVLDSDKSLPLRNHKEFQQGECGTPAKDTVDRD